MIIFKIKDPYEGTYEVPITEDTPQDVLDEIAAYMEENCREIWKADRMKSRYVPYSTDALIYEGDAYAAPDTPETVYLALEDESENGSDEERMRRYLSVLTDTQRRRILMRRNKLTYRDIAEIEGTDESSVRDSVKAAYKKLRKNFPEVFGKHPLKTPQKCPYGERR